MIISLMTPELLSILSTISLIFFRILIASIGDWGPKIRNTATESNCENLRCSKEQNVIYLFIQTAAEELSQTGNDNFSDGLESLTHVIDICCMPSLEMLTIYKKHLIWNYEYPSSEQYVWGSIHFFYSLDHFS